MRSHSFVLSWVSSSTYCHPVVTVRDGWNTTDQVWRIRKYLRCAATRLTQLYTFVHFVYSSLHDRYCDHDVNVKHKKWAFRKVQTYDVTKPGLIPNCRYSGLRLDLLHGSAWIAFYTGDYIYTRCKANIYAGGWQQHQNRRRWGNSFMNHHL
jgi:hypothetical protein